MSEFKKLGLSDKAVEALEKKGFSEPTPIQKLAIPLILGGEKDVVAQASTGTGKTAAFGLPVLEHAREGAGHVQTLILTPTRELAIQVSDELASLKGTRKLRVLPVYGGQAIHLQFKNLKHGVDIVVGTPGRILDHMNRGSLDLSNITHFVLDEADEMCNMGFIDDIREILEGAGENRRTLLFSATMQPDVLRIATEFMGDYEKISVKPKKDESSLNRQIFHEMSDSDRFEGLCRVVDAEPDFYGLVFCRTKLDTAELAGRLSDRGYPAEAIHGDLSQGQREEILRRFRDRKVTILVATDVAARGIDVPDLTHVVNFALPQSPETYVHRVGRTGRAGKKGVAVSLIAPREFRRLMYISKHIGVRIEKQPLPRIEDVIYSKKKQLTDELEEILANGDHDAYRSMARNLMEDHEPEEVLAALLKRSYGDDLDRESYREIRDDFRPGKGESITLRVNVGRSDGLYPKKLVELLSKNADIPAFKIQNVRVQGRYTTFSVPQNLKKEIYAAFKRLSKGGPAIRVDLWKK
ncbi:DEAD/DEAH box helicase [Salidesulfovibrio onnuriiensis]|uniref:DEAD/DEAH box helicase n=1 Tax=Salidesulfovibrio onnuriiensis TaxID=2583823 RepID=UPI0011C6F373|nr:DEAD/DEAH box helicase [Salidesulfovibrio onnuriiensis]